MAISVQPNSVGATQAWHTQETAAVLQALGVDATRGLSDEAARKVC